MNVHKYRAIFVKLLNNFRTFCEAFVKTTHMKAELACSVQSRVIVVT